MDWVTRGMDWAEAGLKAITDPRWLMSHPGWASLLGLVLVFFVGWFCLFRGKKGL